jgi:predicted transcriptional regulator
MRLSKSELRVLVFIASSKEPVHIHDLMRLKLRRETVYRVLSRLNKKRLVERQNKEIVLARTTPGESFKKLYSTHRASPFQDLLADGRVELISKLDQHPKSVERLAKEMGIPHETISYYLRKFLRLGVVKRNKTGKAYLYSINYILWPEIKKFVTDLLEYQTLCLVPGEALVIKNYGDSVLFKSLRIHDATPTSFSAYGEYGIDLDLRDNYYTLPKRDLSLQETFLHSLDSADSLQQRLFCILFYLKNGDKLEGIDHPMMKDIEAVLRNEGIKGYPSLEDIKDRAELYDIEL